MRSTAIGVHQFRWRNMNAMGRASDFAFRMVILWKLVKDSHYALERYTSVLPHEAAVAKIRFLYYRFSR